jgi:hypothetical protein
VTPERIQDRLAVIKSIAQDPEAAHGTEDGLFIEVLVAIAEGLCDDPAECARLALTSRDIDFPRWRA